MTAHNILIIEDNDAMRSALVEQLSLFEEFHVMEASTYTECLDVKNSEHVDLVVLDIELLSLDGREALRVMRKRGLKAPFLLLTGRAGESDTTLGLEAGATEYIEKPFKFSLLIARIRAHLRQYEQSEDAKFNIGHYVFHPAAKLLMDESGRKLQLTEKEVAILKFLYRAGQRPITREVLLHEVWGYNSGITTHTLETHIYRLRQKIEKHPYQATLLVTEDGGYMLVP